MEADVIVYDALVPEAVVAMGRRDAERLPVGKRKGCHSKSPGRDQRAAGRRSAAQGKRVVRLKSGDPLVFGRAGEEMAALRDAGIAYEIVPGITAAFAAAADFELPLTLRGVASSLVFTTGHDLKGEMLPDWARLGDLRRDGRRLYGPLGRRRGRRAADRRRACRRIPRWPWSRTPACAERRLLHGTLADLPALASASELTGPVMTIIGDAVAGADFARLDAARRQRPRRRGAERWSSMKVLTANRLTDGEAVWFSTRSDAGSKRYRSAEVAHDKEAEERLAAIGKAAFAANEVVDVDLIDVDVADGAIVPLRLRERIRAAGPTNRTGSRQAGAPARTTASCAKSRATAPGETTMYRYDEFDQQFVNARVAEFRDQVERRLAGELTEDQFRPLRLMNGVYLQLHAYMLRIAIPYGTLNVAADAHARPTSRATTTAATATSPRARTSSSTGRSCADIPAILADLATRRDACHPDLGQLHPQRHGRSFRRRRRRRGRRSAALCRDPAAVVVASTRSSRSCRASSRSR